MATHQSPEDRQRAAEWARSILATPEDWAILDSETTGLGAPDEIVQLAIIDLLGTVRFDSLLRPSGRKSVPAEATAIHGISIDMLRTAPTYGEVAEQVEDAIRGRKILIYNAEFDARLLSQTARFAGLRAPDCETHDVMNPYSAYIGEWNDYHGNYRWQKLPGGDHSALGDCRATLSVLKRMAQP